MLITIVKYINACCKHGMCDEIRADGDWTLETTVIG